MYTMKQACEMLQLSEHTVRYYTDQGLVPQLKRDGNNRRIFDEESLDWLRGTKYLRNLGMPIQAIKEYQQLCLTDGDEALRRRYGILEEQLEAAQTELKDAEKRVAYLTKKLQHEQTILEHLREDEKNPGKKRYS